MTRIRLIGALCMVLILYALFAVFFLDVVLVVAMGVSDNWSLVGGSALTCVWVLLGVLAIRLVENFPSGKGRKDA